jgi:hypothetical protein
MEITVIQVSIRENPPKVLVRSKCGEAIAHWIGALPSPGDRAFIELQVDGTVEGGKDLVKRPSRLASAYRVIRLYSSALL